MSWTQSDLDKIDAAIARGMRRVTYADHTVEYQTTQDMMTARAKMRAELGLDTASRGAIVFGRIS